MSLFLCLDGIDGAGKSTQLRLLGEWFEQRGMPVVMCRDPGGTPTGEVIRNVVLQSRTEIGPVCEMLLYMASRGQLVDRVIRPALQAGKVVVTDRFFLSTVVYQGYAAVGPNGRPVLERQAIIDVARIATDGLEPHWTGLLDVDYDTALSRRDGPADRIEADPGIITNEFVKASLRRPGSGRTHAPSSMPRRISKPFTKLFFAR